MKNNALVLLHELFFSLLFVPSTRDSFLLVLICGYLFQMTATLSYRPSGCAIGRGPQFHWSELDKGDAVQRLSHERWVDGHQCCRGQVFGNNSNWPYQKELQRFIWTACFPHAHCPRPFAHLPALCLQRPKGLFGHRLLWGIKPGSRKNRRLTINDWRLTINDRTSWLWSGT